MHDGRRIHTCSAIDPKKKVPIGCRTYIYVGAPTKIVGAQSVRTSLHRGTDTCSHVHVHDFWDNFFVNQNINGDLQMIQGIAYMHATPT